MLTQAQPNFPLAPNTDLVVMWDDGDHDSLSLLQHGLQKALVSFGVPAVHRARTSSTRLFARALGKAEMIRPLFPRGNRKSLTVLSWASDARMFPDSYWREPVPWIFDCWEPQFAKWERLLRRHRVATAFFSSKTATKHFSRRIPQLKSYWIPEACDPTLFTWQKPLTSRAIAVLELGRKWSRIHERIRGPLERAGVRHVHSGPGDGKALFPEVSAMYEALGDTAVMICYPRSVTHPESAGAVETLTQRYLEAIGSGCLAMGKAPAELVELFGFDPVLRLSDEDPAKHLLSVLRDLARHQEHVDRARARLLEVGTFSARAKEMLGLLAGE